MNPNQTVSPASLLTESSEASSHPTAVTIWTGRASMLLSGIGLLFLCLGDPLRTVAPTSLAGIVLGVLAIQRGGENRGGPQIGLCLGVNNLVLWVICILIMGRYFGFELSTLDALMEQVKK